MRRVNGNLAGKWSKSLYAQYNSFNVVGSDGNLVRLFVSHVRETRLGGNVGNCSRSFPEQSSFFKVEGNSGNLPALVQLSDIKVGGKTGILVSGLNE